MQPICQHFAIPFPKRRTLQNGGFQITIGNLNLSCGPLTYNDVCSTLRGLAEFMVLNAAYHSWSFQIFVRDYPVGWGQIEAIIDEAAPVSAGNPLASIAGLMTTGIATS